MSVGVSASFYKAAPDYRGFRLWLFKAINRRAPNAQEKLSYSGLGQVACGDLRREYDRLCDQGGSGYNSTFAATAGIPRPGAIPNADWDGVTVFNVGRQD